MTLNQYLTEHRITVATAAKEMGLGHETVRLWKIGARIPRPNNIALVEHWSGGCVSAADWYPNNAVLAASPNEAA